MRHLKKIMLFTGIILMSASQLVSGAGKIKKPYTVVFHSTPFGSKGYNIAAAFEQVFKKSGSWVVIKHQETPGAIYTLKYLKKNAKRLANGELPPVIGNLSVGLLAFMAEGRQMLKKLAQPKVRALISTTGTFSVYGSFDKSLKDLKDFTGKKIGAAERARVFAGLLLDKPLFEKGVGNYKTIKWARLGSVGCKDAMLNGKIVATRFRFLGKTEIMDDGRIVFTSAAPDPATMELMNSGRPINLIPTNAEYVRKGYDFSTDLMLYPNVVKAGAIKGVDHDLDVAGDIGIIIGDTNMPIEVAEEIMRVRYEHRADFGTYHAGLKFFPDNPYPFGAPENLIHPGSISGMKKLGLSIPEIKRN